MIPGVVTDLSSGPRLFDARLPHCGLTGPLDRRDAPRISVSVFSIGKPENLSPDAWEMLASLGFNIPKTHQRTLDYFFANPQTPTRRSWHSLNEHSLSQSTSNIPETTITVTDSDTDEDEDDVVVVQSPSSSWSRRCGANRSESDEQRERREFGPKGTAYI